MDGFRKDDNGRYISDGLSPKQFARLFDQIQKERAHSRRRMNGSRHLTPSLLKNKHLDDIIGLGKKKDGTFFTIEDLKQFEANRGQARKKFTNTQPGITYAQLVAHSQAIDVKRANNNVDDGSGISNASFIGLQHNVALIRVAASNRSIDSSHLVQLRFEEWDEALENVTNDRAALMRLVRKLVAGRASINCDCGRYMYWYRYIATAGNFTISPPKEYVFPKIKNPNLRGVACKHIIHAFTRMQGAGWQTRIIESLIKASKGHHYGDDRKKTTEYFSESEIKQLNRNRKGKTNHAAIKAEYQRYQKRIDALQSKLTDKDKTKIDNARKKLARARQVTAQERERRKAAEAKAKQHASDVEAYKRQLSDLLKMQKQLFIDAQVMAGKTPEEAAKAFELHIKSTLGK
ncbi:phage tail protein (plasmid) [Serratia sp. JSRIV002]|uniref:phage tail protein n=1 Tax=Serratia sp. JSRIV002 TaxID=2831894 RepID=UPI001CBF5B24|nr:phage tail protein [Serratia sp. JSRIV002]UAN54750.1 phage tail protein [Serratia sp. JSRIV002]